MVSNASRRLTRVEMVTMRPIPAAAARATMPSRSSAKSGKSRWQWLSTSMSSNRSGRFDVTRKHRRGWRKQDARFDAHPKRSKVARLALPGNAEEIEQLRTGGRHRRLCQNSDLADNLGGHVKHSG